MSFCNTGETSYRFQISSSRALLSELCSGSTTVPSRTMRRADAGIIETPKPIASGLENTDL